MRYFNYVSVSKVDMLYSQIAPALDKEVSVGFDVKILKAETKTHLKATTNLYKKLSEVTDRLREGGLVGDMRSDKPYISDILPMRVGGYGYSSGSNGDSSPIVFWGYGKDTFAHHSDIDAIDGSIAFALAGSRYHVIGELSNNITHSHSLTGPMTSWFLSNLDDPLSRDEQSKQDNLMKNPRYRSLTEYDVANGAFLAATQMDGELQRVEFLARALHRSNWPDGFRMSTVKNIILGSPLYVCEAE